MDPIPDPILPKKFLEYSRESNPGSLGWQSDLLTTTPNRQSICAYTYDKTVTQHFLITSDFVKINDTNIYN